LQQATHLGSYEDTAATIKLRNSLRDVKEDAKAKGPWWDARHDRANARKWSKSIADAKEDANGHSYEDKSTTKKWNDRTEDSNGRYTVKGLLSKADRSEDRGKTTSTTATVKDLIEDVQAKGPWYEARHDRAGAKTKLHKLNDATEDAKGTSYEDK